MKNVYIFLKYTYWMQKMIFIKNQSKNFDEKRDFKSEKTAEFLWGLYKNGQKILIFAKMNIHL